MPRYMDAAYGGETVVLENEHVRLEVHKRLTGWGWGELFVPDGDRGWQFYAVLEHLAELDAEGLPHPLRLEAPSYETSETDGTQELRFAVRTQEIEPPNAYYGNESPMAGTVVLSLADDEAIIGYRLEVEAQFVFKLKRLRGAWLRVGADSSGAAKDDAIFPGIEWLDGDEWSSGTDWFEHPERLRLTPHPHKVAFPCMAISQDGVGLGLWYEPDTLSTVSPSGYPSQLLRFPQPVFASPNFVDCRNDHIMGLMWPSVRQGLKENALSADPSVMLRKGFRIWLNAEIAVVPGRSLDVVVAWTQRYGMPDPGEPRYPWREAYDRIMNACNTNLWLEGEGWARRWAYRGEGSPVVPNEVRRYIEEGDDAELVAGLKEKVAWCDAQESEAGRRDHPLGRPLGAILAQPDRTKEFADALLELQTDEGDFPFEPQGRHQTAHGGNAAYWRPLGQAGQSAVDLCATAAMALMIAHDRVGREAYKDAAHKALEFAMRFQRPEGGDWWETPLRSPNLLAAGNAAMAYYKGYEVFGDERYRDRAIWWIRGMIPFTHLWEPQDLPMIYNTKPCLNTTAWFLSDWVSKHVQWEVLRVFSMSDDFGWDWAEIDPEVDWATFEKGVTAAVLRWMVDHEDPDWMFRCEYPIEWIKDGAWDTLWADTFDPVNGSYGGGPIGPYEVAGNLRILMRKGIV